MTRSFKSEMVTSDCYLPEVYIGMNAIKELNNHLTVAHYELAWAIQIDDAEKFEQLGGDHLPLDFDIEVTRGTYYKPIMVAAVKGNIECLKLMLLNKGCSFDKVDKRTGVNAFWLSAFYG
jgi:hypothetical protein